MTELNSAREEFIGKRKKALTKLNRFRQRFKKKEKRVKADLGEAGRIWKELGVRFKWWGTLP